MDSPQQPPQIDTPKSRRTVRWGNVAVQIAGAVAFVNEVALREGYRTKVLFACVLAMMGSEAIKDFLVRWINNNVGGGPS